MGKKLQYVSDFAFPSDCGFSGSAGQQMIKGYARGGKCDAGYAKGGLKKAMATKMPKVMGEFKSGKLHSGSKKGPVVSNPKQAVAIAMSEARKMAKTKA
jgi:hypothetical protein